MCLLYNKKFHKIHLGLCLMATWYFDESIFWHKGSIDVL